MTPADREFLWRWSRIPSHGLGLSVDVYSPDLFELLDALEARELRYGYLEIFKAAQPALTLVQQRLPDVLLAYHAEGLWMTQPDLEATYPLVTELAAASTHLRSLGSYWMNHECATKQMAGYSFGTYLPPLFTPLSADVTARNIGLVQSALDRHCGAPSDPGPLLLLETPPLTYFGFGQLSMAEFFRRIAEVVPCGVVLDIGHLWTVYRYSGERHRPVTEFLSEFLDTFPLERVVQIHVAGLAEQGAGMPAGSLPWWLDAHSAPIPELLFDMLAQVLSHPGLTHLKGMALEVGTKSVPQIVLEFDRFCERFGRWSERWEGHRNPDRSPEEFRVGLAEQPASACGTDQAGANELLRQYDLYARVVTGAIDASAAGLPSPGLEPEALPVYCRSYLPREILEWGGDLRDMFPQTCRLLDRHEMTLASFLEYWFREPRTVEGPYDFFLLKLDCFCEFIGEMMPHAAEVAVREAAELRAAFQAACEQIGTLIVQR
ncbi:MAG: multinuclear nonheme iron-dependent oxidase [Nitrospiraceae bacterium]